MYSHSPKNTNTGFTLIELLIVIAIVSILAVLLFPVFAQAREKSRIATCQSNIMQLSGAIHLYLQDSDETMPLGYKQAYQIGPLTSDVNGGIPQAGLAVELMPYVASTGVFLDPDDRGVEWYSPHGSNCEDNPPIQVTCAPAGPCTPTSLTTDNIPVGATYQSVFGISYKFTYENYSNPFPDDNETGRSYLDISEYQTAGYGGTITENGQVQCSDSLKHKFAFTSTAPITHAPKLMMVSFFSRPSETGILHCANSPFDFNDDAIWHSNGEVVGFFDGHAKFVTKEDLLHTGCDGPDWAWDIPGSCNSMGLQRTSN